LKPRGLALRRPSLDDVFLALTGHAAEEDGQVEGRRRGRRRGGGQQSGKDTAKAAS
jgi:ABC-2 type transport system ATP-binding protein